MLAFRTPLQTLLAPIFGLSLTAATLPCAAQLQLDVVPESALAPTQDRAVAGAAARSLPATTTRSYSASSGSSWLGSAIQLEEPRATGYRPVHASKVSRGRSVGIDAGIYELRWLRHRQVSIADGARTHQIQRRRQHQRHSLAVRTLHLPLITG